MKGDDVLRLLPELLILSGAVAGLLAGTFARSVRLTTWICAVALIGALVAAAFAIIGPGGLPIKTDLTGLAFEAYLADLTTGVARLAVAGATLLVLALAGRGARGVELRVLLLLAALGSIALAGATDLLVFVAAYLLASLPAYALAGLARDGTGTEAALKYYLMGAFHGILLLAGVTLLYGLGGTTAYGVLGANLSGAPAPAVAAGFVLVLAGVLFKTGGVPAHFWVPDVTEGSSRAVAAFVTTVPKLGALAGLLRLTSEVFLDSPMGWRPVIAAVAVATMTLGNLAAFSQDNVRRLLAYSTVSQAGYLLIPIAVTGLTPLAAPALLFYLAAYAITNVGAFAVVAAAGRDALSEYAGLARRSPGLAAALIVCLLGLVGTPPAAVFVGKLLVFAAAWDGGYAWLAVVAVINTVASVFYYLRWILPAFRTDGGAREPGRAAGRWVAYVAAAGSVVLGLAAGLGLVIVTG